jgi:hypothetical protein
VLNTFAGASNNNARFSYVERITTQRTRKRKDLFVFFWFCKSVSRKTKFVVLASLVSFSEQNVWQEIYPFIPFIPPQSNSGGGAAAATALLPLACRRR